MRSYSLFSVLLSSILAVSICAQAQTHSGEASKRILSDIQNPLISEFKTFSASVSGGIAHDHDRKIYRSGKWMRLDFDDSYRVNDLDTLEMWSVGANRCVEFNRPDAGSYPFSAYHDFKVERKASQEEETIDGHVCKIETLTLTPTDDRPIVATMKLWEAKDLDGFPIRIEVEDSGQKYTSTYSNVSLSAPDPKLFQHPVKCIAGPQPGQQGVVRVDKASAK
jgi:outer membrane lipoprotein-sorting protein